MPTCAIVLCKNRSEDKNYIKDGISFHRFPNDPTIKEQWINATGRGPNWFPPKRSTICSVHFDEKCFEPGKKIRRLFAWSVPTLKIGISQGPISPEPSTSKVSPESPVLTDYDTKIDDTPRKRKLRLWHNKRESLIKQQRKKIKTLHKKIAELKDVLKELKQENLVNADQVNHLENIGVNDLIKRYEKRLVSRHLVKQKYSPELRTFALTLHFYSPKGYEYVRQNFQTCLPHVRPIKKWYQSVDAQPGFTQESVRALKEKALILFL